MRYVSIKAVNMNFVLCSAWEPGVSRSLVRNLRDCQLDCDVFNATVILNRSKLSPQENPDSKRKRIVACRMRNPGIFFFIVVFEILGFGIWNPSQGIRNPTTDWSSESTFH